ncbi:conjugal transfer protein TraR (plasmid) [Salmonella enterica subsp. enterica]|nr:conjugal transfer protein TraR [Salmonella enterica subsp. enterica]
MADVLDQLGQEDLIHRLCIQAVRQQLSVKVKALPGECCGNRDGNGARKQRARRADLTECQRVLEIREKIIRGEMGK